MSLGVGSGASIGILAARLVDIEIAYGIIFGAGTGLLVGLLTAWFVERRLERGEPSSGIAIGAGLGIVIGASEGLVAAWTLTVNVGYGIVFGAGTGLLLGIFLGAMVSRFHAYDREKSRVAQ